MEPTTVITLALSLAVFVALFLLHRRALNNARGGGIDLGKQQGYTAGLSEGQRQQGQYALGYADGKAEGRELERRERELSIGKAYDRGYKAALDELDSDDFAELRDHARPTLSA